jgi:hypothetical protein
MQTKRLFSIALSAVAIAGFATASTAAAQTTIGVGAGVSLPIGDSGDMLNTGFAAQASATFHVERLPIGVRAELELNRWGIVDAAGGGNYSTIAGIVSGVLDIPMDALGFYVLGGLGIYHQRSGGGDATDFGISLGGGARYTIGTMVPYVEARFHNVFRSDVNDLQFLPITLGLTFPLF